MSENVVGRKGGKSEEIEFFLFSIARLGKKEFYRLCYLKRRKEVIECILLFLKQEYPLEYIQKSRNKNSYKQLV
jgi:hypothetical protein